MKVIRIISAITIFYLMAVAQQNESDWINQEIILKAAKLQVQRELVRTSAATNRRDYNIGYYYLPVPIPCIFRWLPFNVTLAPNILLINQRFASMWSFREGMIYWLSPSAKPAYRTN